jgi:CRISPR-associated endonuclease Cas1
MNARWLTHIFAYKNSPLALASAAKIVEIKIERQNALLKRYRKAPAPVKVGTRSAQDILLSEARAARHFWAQFRLLVPQYPAFTERRPHAHDTVNRLLDLGYHQLTNAVRSILDRYQIPAEIGLLHVARKATSAPLAYDIVELFRSDIVDAEVLRHLRLKKKPLKDVSPKEIARFLYKVHERTERHYYLRDFKICYAYRYYMELQILRLEKAVNHKEIFEPFRLPARHEGRCP